MYHLTCWCVIKSVCWGLRSSGNWLVHRPGPICLYSACVMSLDYVILSDCVLPPFLLFHFPLPLRDFIPIFLWELKWYLPSVVALRFSEASTLLVREQNSQNTWSRGPRAGQPCFHLYGLESSHSHHFHVELLQLLPWAFCESPGKWSPYCRTSEYKSICKSQKTSKSRLNIWSIDKGIWIKLNS